MPTELEEVFLDVAKDYFETTEDLGISLHLAAQPVLFLYLSILESWANAAERKNLEEPDVQIQSLAYLKKAVEEAVLTVYPEFSQVFTQIKNTK